MLTFPNSGGGKPFIRLDGRTGTFSLSSPDGEAPDVFPMREKVLVADIKRAEQGWLKLKDGVDWQLLDDANDWGNPPSPDHNAAVQVDVYCADWPEPQVRQLRGSSRAVVGFVTRLDAAALDAPEGKAIAVKIGGTRIAKMGKGSTAEVAFDVAPRDKWPDRAIFDEVAEADDDAAPPPPPPAPPKSAWEGLEDTARL